MVVGNSVYALLIADAKMQTCRFVLAAHALICSLISSEDLFNHLR
jgi:hypothetical protein